MGRFRITPIVVWIVGVVLCVAAAVLMYMFMIQPTSAEVDAQKARFQPNADYVDPVLGKAKLDAANKAVADAKVQVATVNSQWDYIQRVKNPVIETGDKWKAWFEWTGELEFDFAPRVNNFLAHSGAQPLTTITAPAPPNSPSGVPTGIVAMNLGTLQVFGSYSQILNHMGSWNRFDRIVLVDGLTLQGYSPFMTGAYKATEYIFTKDTPAPAAAPATAAPAAAAAPGAPGGAAGAALPPPSKTIANFEDAPEYHVHIGANGAKAVTKAVAGGRRRPAPIH